MGAACGLDYCWEGYGLGGDEVQEEVGEGGQDSLGRLQECKAEIPKRRMPLVTAVSDNIDGISAGLGNIPAQHLCN